MKSTIRSAVGMGLKGGGGKRKNPSVSTYVSSAISIQAVLLQEAQGTTSPTSMSVQQEAANSQRDRKRNERMKEFNGILVSSSSSFG